MDIPWTEILNGATGGLAVLIVGGIFLAWVLAVKFGDIAEKMVDSKLKHAEDQHKSTLAFASAIDTDLRERRIQVYGELWEKTGVLPIWPWNTELKYEDLHRLTSDFRDWYFKRGGMFLSATAREAYFEVQRCLRAILESDPRGLVPDDDYNAVRKKCRALRTELAEDLLSRREAPALAGGDED